MKSWKVGEWRAESYYNNLSMHGYPTAPSKYLEKVITNLHKYGNTSAARVPHWLWMRPSEVVKSRREMLLPVQDLGLDCHGGRQS